MKWIPIRHNNLSLELNTNSLFENYSDVDSISTLSDTDSYIIDVKDDKDDTCEDESKTMFIFGTFQIILCCIIILFIILYYSNGLNSLGDLFKSMASPIMKS